MVKVHIFTVHSSAIINMINTHQNVHIKLQPKDASPDIHTTLFQNSEHFKTLLLRAKSSHPPFIC